MKYRKQPVVIEAFQYTWPVKKEPVFIHSALEEGVIDVVRIQKIGGSFIETRLPIGEVALKINTLEGPMYALQNDYIIKGVEGELYPCKPDIFHKTYELIE